MNRPGADSQPGRFTTFDPAGLLTAGFVVVIELTEFVAVFGGIISRR
jgi:hypothetical protein